VNKPKEPIFPNNPGEGNLPSLALGKKEGNKDPKVKLPNPKRKGGFNQGITLINP